MSRTINTLVVHCSATPPSRDIGAEKIRDWHVNGNGWSDIGYHYVIKRDGAVDFGRPISRAGAHVQGHNEDTIGICMVGGVDESGASAENFTPEQFQTLRVMLVTLMHSYPGVGICGHRDFAGVNKDCPCFDVKEWYEAA